MSISLGLFLQKFMRKKMMDIYDLSIYKQLTGIITSSINALGNFEKAVCIT